MSLQFYTNPMSRGQIVRWMLEEVGAPYDTHVIPYEEIGGEAFAAINPMKKFPAIVHDGRVVTECAAICAYLADVFPDAGLAPRDAEKADYYRWLFFGAGPVEAAVSNHANGWDPSPERSRMFGYGTYDRTMDTLAAQVAARPYLCGERFTAADVYVGSQLIFGMRFKTIPERPDFTAYTARLQQRPALQRARAIDEALIAEMQG